MAAPAVVGYDGTLADIHRIAGPIAAAIAWVAASKVLRGLRWVNVGTGVLVAATSWIGPAELAVTAISAVTGIVLAAVAPLGASSGDRIGRGWSALRRPL